MFRPFKFLIRIFLYGVIFLALYFYFTRNVGEDVQTGDGRDGMIAPPERPIDDEDVAALRGRIDTIYVDKSERKLWLMGDGASLREYDIALGFAPEGHKQAEGDGKTPIGDYVIDYRNPNSSYHKSLHISYPRPDQIVHAEAEGRNPGGMIMIHGQPNDSPHKGDDRIAADWTAGCIALSNNEIEEIWQIVQDGTRITIVE